MVSPERSVLLEALLTVDGRAFFAVTQRCDILLMNPIGSKLARWLSGGQEVTNLLTISPKRSGERLKHIVKQIFDGQSLHARETRMEYETVGAVWWSVDYAPLRDEGGAIIAAGIWVRDISTQRAELERFASSEVPEAAGLTHAPGVAVVDARAPGRPVIAANDAFVGMMGWPREQLIGKSCPMLIASDQAQPNMSRLRDALGAGEPCELVLRSSRADETVFLNQLTVLPLRLTDSGAPTHFVSVHHDITRAMELEAQAAMMQGLLDSAPGLVLVIDEAQRVVRCFGEVEPLLGWSAEELIGQEASMFGGDWAPECIVAYIEALRRGLRYEGAGRLRARSGELVELTLSAQLLLGVRGAADHFVLFCRDRRAQQALEQELVKMKQLEHVGWMAQGLIHDMNHALTLAMLHLDELSEALGAHEVDGTPLTLTKLALREAANLGRGFGLMVRGGAQEREEIIELDRWLTQVSRALQPLIPPGVELGVIVAPGMRVRAVPARLQQVIFNLVHNAIQALSRGQSAPPRLRLTALAADEKMARLSVEDNGCGMDAAALARAFTPFVTSREDGTGLGLYLCKLIVERLGGQITLSSEPGRGTLASFTLPLVY